MYIVYYSRVQRGGGYLYISMRERFAISLDTLKHIT